MEVATDRIPTISIVIPCKNSVRTLAQTLESLLDLVVPPHEVIIVDDGSIYPIPSDLSRLNYQLIRLEPGLGPAAARNRGAEAATGEILLFIDADVIVQPDIIIRLCDQFTATKELAAIQGIYSMETPAPGLFSQYQNYYYHYAFKRIPSHSVSVCATFCFSVKRELFVQTGGFDEHIKQPTVEDEAYGYSLAGAGHRIDIDPTIQVTHLAKYRIDSFIRRKFRMSYFQAQNLLKGMRPPIPIAGFMTESTTHHSRRVLLSVILTPWILPVALMSPLAGLMAFLAFIMLNSNFWGFILRQGKYCFLFLSIFITFIDHLTIFCGLTAGLLTFFVSGKQQITN